MPGMLYVVGGGGKRKGGEGKGQKIDKDWTLRWRKMNKRMIMK